MTSRIARVWMASIAGVALFLPGMPAQDGADSRSAASRPASRPVPVTPEEKVAAIAVEYEDAMKAFSAAYKAAKTDEEKEKLANDRPKAEAWFPRLMEIAKARSADPAAVKALVWVVSHDHDTDTGHEALALLARDHVASPDLVQVVDRFAYSVNPDAEAFLRSVADRNPKEEVQGRALYALAQLLKNLADLARQVADASDPEAQQSAAKDLEGKKLDRIKAVDVAKTQSEIESLLETVMKKYAAIKLRGGATLGERADRDLFEIRSLAIGKVAPEIEGEDIQGNPLKLSDFKGKVVVLDFWGHW
jgi:hypothetical protein